MAKTVVSVIKGKPIYLYRRSQYLEQPDNTFLGKMYYDEDSNITYVKCIKKSIRFEIFCAVIISVCVAISVVAPTGGKEMIQYSRIVEYYDGGYYMNISNSIGSAYPVLCILMHGNEEVARVILNPGEDWIKADAEYIGRDMKLFIEYQYPILKRFDLLNISILDRRNIGEEN